MPEPKNAAKLHVGCGPVILPGWINIDINHPLADVHIDVTQGLPFSDGSIAFVYAEHFIEHLPRESAVALLRECLRVLRPGGVVRLSTPAVDEVVDAYLTAELGRWGSLLHPRSPAALINEAFRSWGHQFLYNKEELGDVMMEGGFERLSWCEYRSSTWSDLKDLETRPFHNELIVEGSRGNGREIT